MSEIELDEKPKIFDDPEFCENSTEDGFKSCRFLVYSEDCCFFLDEEDEFLSLEQGISEYDEVIAIKCKPCKEAYKKAKCEQEEKEELEKLPLMTEKEIYEHNIKIKPIFLDSDEPCFHDENTICTSCKMEKNHEIWKESH